MLGVKLTLLSWKQHFYLYLLDDIQGLDITKLVPKLFKMICTG